MVKSQWQEGYMGNICLMLNMAVDDMNTVRDFYADRFGFQVTADNEYGGKRSVCMALPGGGIH